MFYYESLFGDKGPSAALAALLLLSLSLHTTFALARRPYKVSGQIRPGLAHRWGLKNQQE
jgi:hypothetical protein